MFSKFLKPNIRKMVLKADVDKLKNILKGENRYNQLTFFETVYNLEVEQAVSLLIDTLAYMWPSDRNKAIKFLGEKKNPNAIKSLIQYLEYDETINALVEIGKSSVEQLINLIYQDCKYQRDKNIKINAIKALGKIGDDRATSHLIKIAKEPASFGAGSAIESLGLIGSFECIGFLIEQLKSTDKNNQRKAYEALRCVERDKITEPLLNALYLNEDNLNFQKFINSLLIEIGDVRAIQTIIDLLKGDNDDIHSKAINALKRIKWTPQSKEQELWMSALKYERGDVKKFNELSLIPAIRLIVNGDKYLREGAAEILGGIRDARSVEFLIQALKDKEIDKIARDSLVRLKEISIKPLISSLDSNSKNYSEQRRIMEAIEKIGDAKAIIPLLELIKQSDDDLLKHYAGEALKNLCISLYRLNEEFTLEQHMSSSNGQSGGTNIPDLLIEALSDENEGVRHLLADIIGSFGNKNLIDLIIDAWRQKKISSSVLIPLIAIPSNNQYLGILKEILISGPQFDRIHAAKVLKMLGWSPGDLNEQVYLWLGEEDWNKIAKLDMAAYEPLNDAFQYYRRESHGKIGRDAKISLDSQLSIIKAIGDAQNVYLDEFIHYESNGIEGHYDIIRLTWIETLGKLSTKKALDSLTLALNDSNYNVRLKAIQKLEEVGYKPAEKSFETKLYDKKSEIRIMASKALDKLNWEPSAPNSLYYFIEINNYEEVMKLGKNSVDRLIEYIKKFDPTNINKLFVNNILCDLRDLRAAEIILWQVSRHKSSLEYFKFIPSNDRLAKIFGDYTEIIINTLSYEKYDDPKLGNRRSGTISELKGDQNIKEFDYTENTKFVKQLCDIRTPLADNLLIIMKTRAYHRFSENWMYHECGYGCEKDGIFTGVNLGIQLRLSKEELERRGNPPYDESVFLVNENWYF
jgi:HEAT repeat protein